MYRLTAVLAFWVSFFVLPAYAETLLLAHKNWTTVIDRFDDGEVYCLSRGYADTGSMALYTTAFESSTLHFFFDTADFGQGLTEDIRLQIDNREPWILYNARLFRQSVFFELPPNRQSERILKEIYSGNALHLLDSNGYRLWSFSLAGSAAALNRLMICKNQIENS